MATLDDVTLPPAAAAQARRQLQAGTDVVLVPLRSDLSSDELIDPAATLREDLDPGTADAGVTPYLVGPADDLGGDAGNLQGRPGQGRGGPASRSSR